MSRVASPALDSALDRRLGAELERLRSASLYRLRRVVEGPHAVLSRVDGRVRVNFCSNDYLGLASDPRVVAAAKTALDRVGTGSGAASLISGFNAEHRSLEEELADFVCRPRALLFSSGWAANLGVVRALVGRRDEIVADELNHASLIDAGRLSGAGYTRVAHRDLRAFQSALTGEAGSDRQRLVCTDSVFSMDGDLADLPALAGFAAEAGATLMVDDAHGFGVLGTHGRGALEHFADTPRGRDWPTPGVGVYVATLGKSLGTCGAFVAGSATLIEYLIQRARTWVFSTAPPPALAAAARAALAILRQEPERVARLNANIAQFVQGAAQRGLRLGPPGFADAAAGLHPTPIQPLVIGDETATLALSARLMERGFWIAAIRPPTVPLGTARLRITLSAAHERVQIENLLDALAELTYSRAA